MKYLFKSKRLGFRQWQSEDIEPMVAINSDRNVMQYFPSTKSKVETIEFIERMNKQFNENGFCYFAVDILENSEFIGFIGLSEQTFVSDFTPCSDIGWRLKYNVWGNGFATEGAFSCLQYGFKTLDINEIYAVAPVVNLKSENIMKKIGMTKIKEFNHPLLTENKELELCNLYEIKQTRIQK